MKEINLAQPQSLFLLAFLISFVMPYCPSLGCKDVFRGDDTSCEEKAEVRFGRCFGAAPIAVVCTSLLFKS